MKKFREEILARVFVAVVLFVLTSFVGVVVWLPGHSHSKVINEGTVETAVLTVCFILNGWLILCFLINLPKMLRGDP